MMKTDITECRGWEPVLDYLVPGKAVSWSAVDCDPQRNVVKLEKGELHISALLCLQHDRLEQTPHYSRQCPDVSTLWPTLYCSMISRAWSLGAYSTLAT